MSGWIRNETTEKTRQRLVCQYNLPTEEYQDIEYLLQHIPYGKGNAVTLAAMMIGARMIMSIVNRGATVDAAVEQALGLMKAPQQQATPVQSAQARSETAADAPVAREGFGQASQNMFTQD